MAGRDDPRWSIRVSAEEDELVKRFAVALGVRPAKVVRAAVLMLRAAPMGALEAAVSGVDAKVPRAAAPRASSRPGHAAGSDSSPAPAAPPAQLDLADVVAGRLGVRRPFAVRSIRQGEVRVGGVIVRDPTRLVDPSVVSV